MSAPSWSEHLCRVRRRLVSVPILLLVGSTLALSLPIAIPALAILDLVRPTRPWARCRAVLSLQWIALCEVIGVATSFALWLVFLVHRDQSRFLRHNTALQRLWTTSLFAGAKRIFAMRVEATGLTAATHGPMLVLVRHASLVDTVLTAAVLANPNKLRLRYVLKKELLWDPCIDIVGNRLPNAFVSRGANSEMDLAKVKTLALKLMPDEGVLIYPEGTRFSAAKLRKLQARLASDPVTGPSAAMLRHVLPPRLGGTLALARTLPGVDVVVLAHTGLEGAASLRDFWRGELVGKTLRVRATRIAAKDVPGGADLNAQWLMRLWQDVDTWIDGARD